MKKLKILQVNAWGGRIKDGLTNFIAKNNFDIVCMQEAVWSNHDDFLTLFVDTIDKINFQIMDAAKAAIDIYEKGTDISYIKYPPSR